MFKHQWKTILLLNLLALTSCNKKLASSSNTLSSGSDKTSEASSEMPSSSLTSISSEPITSSENNTSASLVNETIYYHSNTGAYGNTNGNANNMGVALFDHRRNVHYFAQGTSVFSYNPQAKLTTKLFSYMESGHIQNMALLGDDLYFVATQTNFLYRYNLLDKAVYGVFEDETNLVYGYNNTLFANVKRLNVGELKFGLTTYNHDKKSATTKFSAGTTLVNINGTRLYYTENYGLSLNVMADGFNGRTSIYHFSREQFRELIASHLVSVSNDSIPILTFALIFSGSQTSGLYLYNTSDDRLDQIMLGNIHSVNSDDKYLYFISGNNLYTYDLKAKTLSSGTYLYEGAQYLYVLNHWLYFSNARLTQLYRRHPDTHVLTTDFWNI